MKNNKANYCSNCGASMPLTGHCIQCGEIETEYQRHRELHLCEYSDGARKCQATGVLSKSIGGNGRFYCAAHFKSLDNPDLCNAILDDYELNGLPDKRDWRDVLMDYHMNNALKEKESA